MGDLEGGISYPLQHIDFLLFDFYNTPIFPIINTQKRNFFTLKSHFGLEEMYFLLYALVGKAIKTIIDLPVDFYIHCTETNKLIKIWIN